MPKLPTSVAARARQKKTFDIFEQIVAEVGTTEGGAQRYFARVRKMLNKRRDGRRKEHKPPVAAVTK